MWSIPWNSRASRNVYILYIKLSDYYAEKQQFKKGYLLSPKYMYLYKALCLSFEIYSKVWNTVQLRNHNADNVFYFSDRSVKLLSLFRKRNAMKTRIEMIIWEEKNRTRCQLSNMREMPAAPSYPSIFLHLAIRSITHRHTYPYRTNRFVSRSEQQQTSQRRSEKHDIREGFLWTFSVSLALM